MIEKGGYRIYEEGDHIPVSEDWPPFPEGKLILPYGIKLVDVDGEYFWRAAEKEDKINAVAKMRGIDPEDVELNDCECYFVSLNPPTCQRNNGYCMPPSRCYPVQGPGGYWACDCSQHHHDH